MKEGFKVKIAKRIPQPIKNAILYIVRLPARFKVWLYHAAGEGRVPFPDKAFQKWDYKIHTGRKLNLRHPETYCEKLQWMKYYYRNPAYTQLVDKYAVRAYVKEKIGEEYLVPLYGVYDSFDEIRFDLLPNQFVLKCTHDSGSVVICKDKDRFDFEAAREKLTACMKRNQFYLSREWPYKNVKPRIIAEKYLESGDEVGFVDYKFFCFDGSPVFVQVCSDRFTDSGLKENNFDMDWNELPFRETGMERNSKIQKPLAFEQMKHLAAVLSQDMPHVRADFFFCGNTLYFSELTFFNSGGRHLFEPEEYNKKIGELIHLPPKMRG